MEFADDFVPKTFEDLACYWIVVYAQTHKSPASLKRDQGILRNYLLPKFGSRTPQSMSVREIDGWFSSFNASGSLSPKSCNHILGLLQKIFNDALRWGFLEVNPASRVIKKRLVEKPRDFWHLEEIQQYLGFWAMQEIKPRIYHSTVIALYSGMRRGELQALKWKSVDFSQGFINVCDSYCRISKRMTGTTKSRKDRQIPICTVLKRHLERLQEQTGKSDYVLPFFDPDRYIRDFRMSARTAGVREIRFHELRHTFASQFLAAGGDIYILSKILGHSSVQVTERYCHLILQHLKGKTEILKY